MPTARIVCCGEECVAPVSLDLRGLLGFWLLWELRLGPLRGAQLADRLAWRRGQEVSPGTLYPALAAMTKRGVVRKDHDGRDTSYTLTAAGKREVACAQGVLRAMMRDVMA